MELIKIIEKDNRRLVSARELHHFLEISTRFDTWMVRMFEYGFTENIDYLRLLKNVQTPTGGNRDVLDDYVLLLDMAKEISMIQRSDKGKQARQYFIECEKNLLSLKPVQFEYNLPKTKIEAIRALLEAEIIIEKQNEQLLLAEPKIAFFDNVVKTEDCFDLSQVAAMLKIPNGKKFYGRNQIFEKLRELKYLLPDSTLPYKSKIDLK